MISCLIAVAIASFLGLLVYQDARERSLKTNDVVSSPVVNEPELKSFSKEQKEELDELAEDCSRIEKEWLERINNVRRSKGYKQITKADIAFDRELFNFCIYIRQFHDCHFTLRKENIENIHRYNLLTFSFEHRKAMMLPSLIKKRSIKKTRSRLDGRC